MRAEYHRWQSARPASKRAMPTRTSASTTIRPRSLLNGGFRPIPSSMICLPISDGATATRASTITSPIKMIKSRLYGAANRTIRRRVPGASCVAVTDGSRLNDRIICMGPPWPGPMVTTHPLQQLGEGRRSKSVDPCQRTPDDQLLDLAGSLVQRRNPRIPQVLPGGVLIDVAVAAVRLHAVVRSDHGRLGREQLRLARGERVVVAAALQVGHPPGHQTGGVERDRGIGEELLNELVGRDLLAELLALRRVLDHRVQAGLDDPRARRGDGHPPVVERRQRRLDAGPLNASEQRIGTDHDVVEDELRSVAGPEPELAVDLVGGEPLAVRGDEEGAHALAPGATGAGHHEREPSDAAVRDEDLASVDAI